ncbi:hypothetical protein [Algisphaera agarilytica]|uniref:PEP-CTERM protein-sorting domain-containing protein n=1 Tax=Algisphaera agarilytica TaxID=1385975 RepID=A0A7X0H5R9_9BACT|nr:hypothetical protein [Algisphaera agarilytica]MBB6428319.1 hypothetical protein [Algisphaera agarilytica]
MRFSVLSAALAATAVCGLGSTQAFGSLVNYTDSNRVIAANSEQTFSLLGAGVIGSTDSYTIEGTMTFDFTGDLNFDALFLITDGTVEYGGEVDEIGSGSSPQVLVSANAGDAFTAPETNGNAVTNQAGTSNFVVDFVITGDGSSTTATVSVGSDSNSIEDSVIPDGFIAPLAAEDGFSLVLVNLEGIDFTFDDIAITIIPEPMSAVMLGGLSLLGLRRRRKA